METNMKIKTIYEPHNPDDLIEGWAAVKEYLNEAALIAFDGCHKIYLAMDLERAEWFTKNYNGDVCTDIESSGQNFTGSPEEMLKMVREWWDESCPLRFVSAVWHTEVGPNRVTGVFYDGFVSLISQMADLSSQQQRRGKPRQT